MHTIRLLQVQTHILGDTPEDGIDHVKGLEYRGKASAKSLVFEADSVDGSGHPALSTISPWDLRFSMPQKTPDRPWSSMSGLQDAAERSLVLT